MTQRLLLATATRLTANLDTSTVSGLLIPFGEIGYTSVGPLPASVGTLTPAPEGEIVLNIEHDRHDRVGRCTRLTETPDGWTADFRLVDTQRGRDALVEAAEGLRACLSVEIDDWTSDGKGAITSGTITGAALVVDPAFPSAKLAASQPDKEEPMPEKNENPTTDHVDPAPIAATVTSVSNPLAAAASITAPKHDLAWLAAATDGAMKGDRQLLAALTDITPPNILGIEQPEYIGELWRGRAYSRRYISRVNSATLNSWKVQGWRWKTRPGVAEYTGNKTAVPSGAAVTEAVEIQARRIAGAHDIDRKFVDFQNTEFFNAYYTAMTESYAKVSDEMVLADIKSKATAVTRGTVPANIAAGLVSVIDGALAIMSATDTMPDTAFLAPALWREIALTPQQYVLGYLEAAIGLETGHLAEAGFTLAPSALLGAAETLVWCRDAVTVHELGGSPIRVDAINVANGGVDTGVFGYLAINVHNTAGIALVKPSA